jgi:purine-binding chemotaxis protein CheW
MPESDLIAKITEAAESIQSADQETELRYRKFIIVGIMDKRCAIPAAVIREIVIDVPIHFVPFVPPYIRGFVNRHGEPYTVVDLGVLFEQKATEERSFLVLNLPDDQLAFLVSDIHEILKVPESDVFPITEKLEDDRFFEGSVRLGSQDVFIVSVDGIRTRMAGDLGKP